MKNQIRKDFFTSCNVKNVKNSIEKFQKKMTPEYCQKFINKLKDIIIIVIKKDGSNSNY